METSPSLHQPSIDPQCSQWDFLLPDRGWGECLVFHLFEKPGNSFSFELCRQTSQANSSSEGSIIKLLPSEHLLLISLAGLCCKETQRGTNEAQRHAGQGTRASEVACNVHASLRALAEHGPRPPIISQRLELVENQTVPHLAFVPLSFIPA